MICRLIIAPALVPQAFLYVESMVRTVLAGGVVTPMCAPPQYPGYYSPYGAYGAQPYGAYPAAPAVVPGSYEAEQAYVNAEVAAGRIVGILSSVRWEF